MKNKIKNSTSKTFSAFCWNIGNPSLERAGKQAVWLRSRPEDILILTETKWSDGCLFLEKYFQAYGYNVVFPRPEGKEFGTMIISKRGLIPSDFSSQIGYLQARTASVEIKTSFGQLEVIGVYVPSRDASYEKISKKRRFLENLINNFKSASGSSARIFCGDFNILEPNHIPHYHFFEEWEYDFYKNLKDHQLYDAFRHLNPDIQEYSWVGRTNDGYRYDHCFVSNDLLSSVKKCHYIHEPRKVRLSDHSAIITELEF